MKTEEMNVTTIKNNGVVCKNGIISTYNSLITSIAQALQRINKYDEIFFKTNNVANALDAIENIDVTNTIYHNFICKICEYFNVRITFYNVKNDFVYNTLSFNPPIKCKNEYYSAVEIKILHCLNLYNNFHYYKSIISIISMEQLYLQQQRNLFIY